MTEKVEELETLTSNSSMLGSTEVAASVSVLVTATSNLTGNISVSCAGLPFFLIPYSYNSPSFSHLVV